jgi:cation diffusion facilitator family transporter
MESNRENTVLSAIRRITWIGAISNLVLVALKFVAGFLGNSSVIIADAIHSLSDLITDVAILLGMQFWSRPADRDHPYGHAKIENLITLFIGVSLVAVGIGLLYGAIVSLIDIISGVAISPPTGLPLVAALVSIAVKEWLYRITVKVGMTVKSSVTIANAWHHRSDAMSSIPAAIAIGVCLFLGPQFTFLDPVGTVVVSFMIIHAAWKVSQPTFAALLDSGASEPQCKAITETIRSFSQVKDLHKLRTRYVGPSGLALDVHIHVDPNMTVTEAHALSHQIQNELLQSGEHIIEAFVHVEPANVE